MAGAPVLIAAFSGRALAASARRAGYAPLVADFFADEDTQSCAAQVQRVTGDLASGFDAVSLRNALASLAESVDAPTQGVVYGAGFEDRPSLLSEIAGRWPLLGNAPETVRAVKDPWRLAKTLSELGIPHPEIRGFTPPHEKGWLAKRAGGAGGVGIACAAQAAHDARTVYQRHVAGKPVSALLLGGPHNARVVGFSEQWAAPAPGSPFRFGGAVRPASCSAGLSAELAEATAMVAKAFGLRGLNSIDFIVGETEWWLIEINPRPGATMDLFDDDQGRLFAAHIAAVRGNAIPALPDLRGAAALEIVYTPARIEYFPSVSWPDWIVDRPAAGSIIAEQAPCYTVLATGKTPCEALRLCRERASQKLE